MKNFDHIIDGWNRWWAIPPRLVIGGIFIYHGFVKLFVYRVATTAYFASLNIPLADKTVIFVGIIELISGLSVLLGWWIRLGALLLLGDMLVAFFLAELPAGITTAGSKLVLTLIAVLFSLFLGGSGAWSLDKKWCHWCIAKSSTILLAALVLSGALFLSHTVFAAGGGGGGGSGGGGGGGGGSVCSADTWSCGEWSACALSGAQTRSCTLSFDCPSADTPKLPESQSCTPACTADTWSCGEWSACSADRLQTRNCTKTFTCAGALQSSPITQQPCTPHAASTTKLRCGNRSRRADRVKCRLRLSKDELERELALQYLPEECRAMKNGPKKQSCIALYRDLRSCWNFPVGEERITCVKEILQWPTDFSAEKNGCLTLTGALKQQCLSKLNDKAYRLVKFRFYDLEERAEDLLADKKISLNAAATFITNSETVKQRFNAAKTFSQRVAYINQVSRYWNQLTRSLEKAMPELQEDYLVQAQKELMLTK